MRGLCVHAGPFRRHAQELLHVLGASLRWLAVQANRLHASVVKLMSDWSGTVYLLCAVASVLSAIFVAQSYVRERVRVWFWSAASFVMLAIANVFAAVEALFEPPADFFLFRAVAVLFAVTFIVYGFVWEEA